MQVKARQRRCSRSGIERRSGKRFNQSRRPKYLFSGLTKCGECGGGSSCIRASAWRASARATRGTCTNRLTISRQEVEERVLVALRDKLMRRGLLRGVLPRVRERDESAADGAPRQPVARSPSASSRAVEREIRKVIEAIKDGVSALPS